MNTTELLTLLKAMSANSYAVHEECRKDRQHAMARQYMGETIAFDTVVFCLQDPDFYARMKEIYLKEA